MNVYQVADPDPDGSVNDFRGWIRFRIPNKRIRIQLVNKHFIFYKITQSIKILI